MKIPTEGKLLRIFIGEADKWNGKPLYQEIVYLAKKENMAEDLPIIIEIVDSEEKINNFLPHLDNMVKEGLVTLERANVVMYRAEK